MEIKIFEALTMSDAIKAIKTEFGPDAVILKTKEKTDPNHTDRKIIEVTAAKPISTRNITGASVDISLLSKDLKYFEDKISSIDSKLQTILETIVQKNHIYAMEASLDEMKKILLESIIKNYDEKYKELPQTIASLDQYLKVMGINEVSRNELIQYLKEIPVPNEEELKKFDSTDNYYTTFAMKWMMKKIKIAPQWDVIDGTTSVHVLFGPTGCGKTSTIAKLAYMFNKKHKANVLIVSCDYSRLAANDQLRIYAKIINVPFEEISNYDELKSVIQKYNNIHLVFVDTAGISPKQIEKIKELETLKNLNLIMANHLVLSITEKELQLERTIRNFSSLGIQSLIFTKLDESWSYGEIFNLATRWSLPLSYFAIGQKIPEDIERASRERVIERIFGR